MNFDRFIVSILIHLVSEFRWFCELLGSDNYYRVIHQLVISFCFMLPCFTYCLRIILHFIMIFHSAFKPHYMLTWTQKPKPLTLSLSETKFRKSKMISKDKMRTIVEKDWGELFTSALRQSNSVKFGQQNKNDPNEQIHDIWPLWNSYVSILFQRIYWRFSMYFWNRRTVKSWNNSNFGIHIGNAMGDMSLVIS
jgi:hypothetical protein